ALARVRIDGDRRAVADFAGPVVDRPAPADADSGRALCWRHHGESAAGEVTPGDVFLVLRTEDGAVIVPHRGIKQPRARTEGGRIPVRSTLSAGPCRRALRLRRLNRAPVRVESACPIHLDEGLTQKKFARNAIEHIEE